MLCIKYLFYMKLFDKISTNVVGICHLVNCIQQLLLFCTQLDIYLMNCELILLLLSCHRVLSNAANKINKKTVTALAENSNHDKKKTPLYGDRLRSIWTLGSKNK